MAVFTSVSNSEAQALLAQYRVGDFIELTGIPAGIENTNYFLDTTEGSFVLTVFEVLNHEQLPFYVELMHWLAQRQIPVPLPQTRRDGKRISTLHGKPAIIVSKLPGKWVSDPTVEHCELAAQTMARSHLAGADFNIRQPNLRGLDWWRKTAPEVAPFLTVEQESLLKEALEHQIRLSQSPSLAMLAQGPAHCDYFRDNVLFTGSELVPAMGGVIDFYFAGCDYWLFDIAVAVNDWCIDRTTGELQNDKVTAWLAAYAAIRPFTDAERRYWPDMLQAAALRFWVSRLYDFYKPRPAKTLKPHDPTHFERILSLRMTEQPPPLPESN
jgi:homoserine kinase type II